MIRLILLSIILLSLQGCGSDKNPAPAKKPTHILSKDSMAFYLSEIHIVDAALRHRDVRKKGLQAQAKQGFINYFDTAHVSKARFTESLDYWKDNYEEMEEIYDQSMEILSTQLVTLKKVESQDSLKALNSKKR